MLIAEGSPMRTYLIVFVVICAAFFGVEYTKPVKDQPMVIIGYQDE